MSEIAYSKNYNLAISDHAQKLKVSDTSYGFFLSTQCSSKLPPEIRGNNNGGMSEMQGISEHDQKPEVFDEASAEEFSLAKCQNL